MSERTLAIAIAKGGLGLAIFEGQHPICLEAHSLNKTPKAADFSAGHIFKCVERFGPAIAVIEQSSETPEDLHNAVLEGLRACNRPIFDVSEAEVLKSFGDPPPGTKKELRQLVRVLFPQIPAGPPLLCCLDAVATGLYFETKRLLSLKQQNE